MKLRELVSHLLPAKVSFQGQTFSLEKFMGEKWAEVDIRSVEMDSREVKEGSLFVCLRGFKSDGHRFAPEAVKKGACAVVAEERLDLPVPVILVPDTRRALAYLAACFYQNPTRHLRLIGVTGTNGKTSVTYFIEKILEDQGHKTGRIGTINMKIGDKILPVQNTTPESLYLQRAFREMVREQCSHAVMEVSSHALELGRVRGLDFDVAVFTNLTQDHLDFHGTMEEYKRAKGLLFAQLGSAIHFDRLKFAVLNADDQASSYFREITAAQVLTYGIRNEADIVASDISLTAQGVSFTVKYEGEEVPINLSLPALFNVYNALAAIGVGLIEKIPLAQIKDSLEKMKGIPGRMEVVPVKTDFTVIVDYAHTPDGLENVLSSARQFTEGSLYCVVGCGGDRDRTKRPLMARIATEKADFAVFTSDNPRSEDPRKIIEEMEAGLKGHELLQTKYTSIVNRKEAIYWVLRQAKAKDVIVVAGKGHETYQEINGVRHFFDDRQVVIEAVQGLNLERGD